MSDSGANNLMFNHSTVEIGPDMKDVSNDRVADMLLTDQAVDITSTTEPKISKLLRIPENASVKAGTSTYTLVSQSSSSSTSDQNGGLGRPDTRNTYLTLDMAAVLISVMCLIVSVLIVLPDLTIAWRIGFQSQIIAIGFLLGLMNICANKVVPPCLVALEASHGASRLQNFEAIITNKFSGSHVNLVWRTAILFFLGLPLGLSIGYKQFIGGSSSAPITLLGQNEYGVSFPNIGDWAPVQDPTYLEFSADAAFHSASQNDTVVLDPATKYPVAYGINLLLLSQESAAILDLPTNAYLEEIRSKLKLGETWQINATVEAYISSRDEVKANSLRNDDEYWTNILNRSDQGLASYYLAQDARTYMGLLAVVGQPSCWLGIFEGGPTTLAAHSKSIEDPNMYGFRTSAELFTLSRGLCEATWIISTTSLTITHGTCAKNSSLPISQEPVLGCTACPWSINGGPSLAHVYADFVTQRPNSTWLTPRYAVTAATTYWARGVYMIPANNLQGFTYSARNETIESTRSTLEAAPLLFACLAVQPAITILAFVLAIWLSVPLSGNFGLVAVLAGIQKSSLDLLHGAAFSGRLKQPLTLDIWVTEKVHREFGGISVASVQYELRSDPSKKYKLPEADKNTLYF